MKLLLASSGLHDHRAALAALLGEGGPRRAAIVANARDAIEVDHGEVFEREAEVLRALGLHSELLDLRRVGGDPDGLRERLETFRLVWVLGGNTFLLARAMAGARFSEAARPLIDSERLVYAGYSAGACVAGNGLEGCEEMDDREEQAIGGDDRGGPSEELGDAVPLELVPWRIVPHFRSDSDEAARAECAVESLLDRALPLLVLRDGQALIIDGSKTWVDSQRP